MYDFMVYGYYATAISRAFFPSKNAYASLMLTLVTFGAGFLMRPLGALILGAYIDHHGRRKGLVVTLGLMALGSLLIACVPSYATIGLLAPLLVLAGRLLQGFSAGVELGGVSIYLAELAPPERRGFFVAWQSASQQIAVICASAIGVALHTWLSPDDMDSFGWRIPFFVGCAIVPALFLIRRSLQETEEFAVRKQHPSMSEIFNSLLVHWGIIAKGVMLIVMSNVSFYLITAYTATYGKQQLNLEESSSLLVAACVGLSNFFWLPVIGALSDRTGRKPLLICFTALTIVSAYPAMHWLTLAPSFGRLLTVNLWLSFLYASYNGAAVITLAEVMPRDVRTTGFSLAYSLSAAIFGGFTPAICTFLVKTTGNKAAPGLWMTFAACSGLVAAMLLGESRGRFVSSSGVSETTSPGEIGLTPG